MGDAVLPRRFIGRREELLRLDAVMAVVRNGVGHTVIVAGEAGVGKTRFVEHWAERIRAAGVQVLAGACLQPGGGAVPYAPFVEALRAVLRTIDAGRQAAMLGPGRRELVRILPELGVASQDTTDSLEFDQSGQARLFEAVLGVVERLARVAPVAVLVDDLPWADEGTRDLLGFLIRSLRRGPVLFVITTRTDGLDRRDPTVGYLAEIERDDQVVRLDIPRFDLDELGELLEPRLGLEPTRERVQRIFDRTDGNPFFAEQLAVTEAAGHGELSPRLRDVLVARLAGLTDETQRVIRVASAAGRRLDDESVAAVMSEPLSVVADALREALRTGILVSVDDAYAFRHALLREVAYSDLLHGERERLHVAFATVLTHRGEIGGRPVSPAELAYHWDAAGDDVRAVPAHVAAGLAAEHVYAFAEASRQFDRALERWELAGIPGDGVLGLDSIAVMQRAADCAVLTGAYGRAIELGRAAAAALEGEDPPDLVRLGSVHERLRWYLWEAGDQAGAIAAVSEALRLIPMRPPTKARARALAQAAGLRLVIGELGPAQELASEALVVARATDGVGEEALALGILGWSTAVIGDVDRGIAKFQEGLSIAERIGSVEGIALGHANLAALLDRVGRTLSSLETAMDGYAIVRRLGVARTYGGILLGHAAKAQFDLGRLTEAASTTDEGLDLDPAARSAVWLHVNRARIDTNQGRFEDAAGHLRQAKEVEQGVGVVEIYRPSVLAAVAELAMWQGRIEDVRSAAAEGLASVFDDRPIDPALGWLAWHALRAEANVGEEARARQDDVALADVRRHVEPIAKRLVSRRGEAASPADARRGAIATSCRAELERLEGRRNPASWERAVTAWTATGRPLPAAYARYRLAEAILGSHGPREAAAGALREAAATATMLGTEPLLREIERLARHARVDLRLSPSTAVASSGLPDAGDPYDLTERENEVLRLVAAGWSNQQIADALFITRKTASVHVSNILGKFGVRNRVEVAAVAHRLGLVDEAPPPS